VSATVTLLLAAVAGLALGLLYFGGLWLTVRRIARTRHPGPLFALSLLLRMALTLAGFYLVMDGSWQRMLACLAGFIAVRQLLVSRLRPDRLPAVVPEEGAKP